MAAEMPDPLSNWMFSKQHGPHVKMEVRHENIATTQRSCEGMERASPGGS